MAGGSQTYRNHYVPQWYQRRFLTHAVHKFYYLDLKPETVTLPGGRRYLRNAVLRWGPKRCFYQDDLYTLKLGAWTTDAVERVFFGKLDSRGEKAVRFVADYQLSDDTEPALHDLMRYMDAQRFRTPRGLDWVKSKTDTQNHNVVLGLMQRIFNAHATMWLECLWEVVQARPGGPQFLLTDNPVSFFNPRAFPASPRYAYPSDAELAHVGTRTIFPLASDRCLVLTHVQFLRDPWQNPERLRSNARAYQTAMFDMRKVQTGRVLSDDEILRINFILKRRASRYVAAAEEDDLYPEERVSTDHWSKLEHDWFLLPNPYLTSFSGGIVMGWDDGRSYAVDEYGRRPSHPDYDNDRQRGREMATFDETRKHWAVKREHAVFGRNHDPFESIAETLMRRDLEDYRSGKWRSRR